MIKKGERITLINLPNIILFILLLPFCAVAQAPYFTAFGQLTIPTGDFGRESENTDAFADLGYGGGIDLNIHINESLIWLTSLTFSANELNGNLQLNEKPILLSSTYSFYNLPVLTGLAYEKSFQHVRLGLWGQAGLNYAEFPSISGVIPDEFSIQNNVDTRIDGKTSFGFSLGARAAYNKIVLAVRYMHFGDYAFQGDFKSSRTAMERPLEFKSSISFFMISLGYNLDLLGER